MWMGQFFKIFPNLSKNCLKFKKILEKSGCLGQNLAQNKADWYMNGSIFLEKLVFVWVYFQILWRYSPTKTTLEYPLPGINDLRLIFVYKLNTYFLMVVYKIMCIKFLLVPCRSPTWS